MDLLDSVFDTSEVQPDPPKKGNAAIKKGPDVDVFSSFNMGGQES